MAFEQNQALQRLLDPIALQQGTYDQERQLKPYLMPPRQSPYQGLNRLQMNQPQMMQMQELPQKKSWLKHASEFLWGTNPQYGASTSYTPYQQQLIQQQGQLGQQNLQDPYAGFDKWQNYLTNYFNENVIPNIANQFTSGTNSATSSPDFAKRLQGGLGGLGQQLTAHRMQFGQQNQQLGQQQINTALTPQYQTHYQPATTGLLGDVLGQAGSLAKAGVNAYKAFRG